MLLHRWTCSCLLAKATCACQEGASNAGLLYCIWHATLTLKQTSNLRMVITLHCMDWTPAADRTQIAKSVLTEGSIGMQNPVATVVYLVGNMQLLAPLISLLLETQPFCQSALRSRPMLLLSLFYLNAAFGTIVAPLQSIWNPLQLYDFPQSFRWQHGGAIVVTTLLYAVVIRVTRRILACHDRRRLRPV